MAGDWIKMRSDLYRDPKVSVIADELLGNQGDLARYVSQMNQRDMCVTRNVMRNATVGALVSVWGVIRQRGKRVDDDLACSGVVLAVIDDIADLPGFGEAMASVGWIIESPEGLVFPRFFEEHNVDPAERSKATNADRQRRYRERKQAEESDVTRNVTVTPREEKSREEKKAPLNPPADAGGDLLGGQAGKVTKAERIAQIAGDAQTAYNAILAKPNGSLAVCTVLNKPRVRSVEKALPTVRQLCTRMFGNERVTPDFWKAYFETVSEDDFLAGRHQGGPGHENWKPDFEYLLRESGIAKAVDRAMSQVVQ